LFAGWNGTAQKGRTSLDSSSRQSIDCAKNKALIIFSPLPHVTAAKPKTTAKVSPSVA
jgi:hypothetical protein